MNNQTAKEKSEMDAIKTRIKAEIDMAKNRHLNFIPTDTLREITTEIKRKLDSKYTSSEMKTELGFLVKSIQAYRKPE